MATIFELVVYFIINGFTTAFIVVISDLFFKKQVEKAVNKAIAKAKLLKENGDKHEYK